jgi:hypothetical protein
MAILQDTYADNIEPGLVGQVANSEPRTVISRTIDAGAGVQVPFAAPVIASATDDHAVSPVVDAASVVVGVLVRDTTLGAERDYYQDADTAGMMESGVLWVRSGAAVAKRAAAYYDIAADRWRGGAAAGRVAVPHATFDDTATAADQMIRVSIRKRIGD